MAEAPLRTNLLRPPTSFVGRRADLEALARIFTTERLLTVLGPPGIGKTRLAIEYAARRLSEGGPEGGVWFCDLTEVRDADGVSAAVARALDVPMTAGSAEAAQRLGAALAARGPLLLVLDNFEQLTAHAAATVGVWRDMAPAARLLVTSRERLYLPGEALHDLSPLSLSGGAPGDAVAAVCGSEAGQLFLERARAVRSGYDPTPQDAGALAALLAAMDGLPLAIELAAARMRALTPAQILARLDQRFRLLSAVPGEGRQGSLERAIDFSWELLSPWERAALSQCAVFRGGFTIEAAEAVLDLSAYEDAPWTLDALQILCDKSLVYRYPAPDLPGEARYALYL